MYYQLLDEDLNNLALIKSSYDLETTESLIKTIDATSDTEDEFFETLESIDGLERIFVNHIEL